MENNDLHLSFEFFPAKTAQASAALLDIAHQFNHFLPDLFTVTYGAGGSTREKTLDTVLGVSEQTQITTAAHLACIGASKTEIKFLLDTYQSKNIDHLVALRGDTPSGMQDVGDFGHGIDAVRFIREHSKEFFNIIVAAYPEYHPQAASPDKDLQYFIEKVKAGANFAFTQYFFNPDAYFFFVDQCEAAGVTIPIIPGIMPITNYKQLARFSDACGAEIPRWIRQKLSYYDAKEDKASIEAFGIDVVSLLCHTLIENGAPGIHFYTMNKFEPTANILTNLNITSAAT